MFTTEKTAMAAQTGVSLTFAADHCQTDNGKEDRDTESENTIHFKNPPNFFTIRN